MMMYGVTKEMKEAEVVEESFVRNYHSRNEHAEKTDT